MTLAADTALPPSGRYLGTVAGYPGVVEVTGADTLRVEAGPAGDGPVAVAFHPGTEAR